MHYGTFVCQSDAFQPPLWEFPARTLQGRLRGDLAALDSDGNAALFCFFKCLLD